MAISRTGRLKGRREDRLRLDLGDLSETPESIGAYRDAGVDELYLASHRSSRPKGPCLRQAISSYFLSC
jgi:hypothetical protein